MHDEFLDVAAVRLVWRHVEPELDGADELAIEEGVEQNGPAGTYVAKDARPPRRRLPPLERQHEAG